GRPDVYCLHAASPRVYRFWSAKRARSDVGADAAKAVDRCCSDGCRDAQFEWTRAGRTPGGCESRPHRTLYVRVQRGAPRQNRSARLVIPERLAGESIERVEIAFVRAAEYQTASRRQHARPRR